MKRKRLIVRAVSIFMVGLITTLALVIPTSAIMTEYPTEDNNTYADCVMPFNVNFVGTDGTLDYVYSVPVGYNSPVVQTGIQGHETLTGRVLGDGGVTANTASLEYVYYPTEWRVDYWNGGYFDDGWGGVPVTLRIDNTELVGKTIVIEAPTFYVNPLASNWYYADDPESYNRWSMGAFRMPALSDPTTKAYVGTYSVSANIVDDVGTKHPVEYSKRFDTRVDNDWIPMLEASIFQDYVINSIQETGYNRIVAVTDFKAYVDYDYYEYVVPVNNISFTVDAESFTTVQGTTWETFVEGYNNDTFREFEGEIQFEVGTDIWAPISTDGTEANIVAPSDTIQSIAYLTYLGEEEPTDELAGTWVFNETVYPPISFDEFNSFVIDKPIGVYNYSVGSGTWICGNSEPYSEIVDYTWKYNIAENSSGQLIKAFMFGAPDTTNYTIYAYLVVDTNVTVNKEDGLSPYIRSVTITDGYDELGSWLEANATKQGATSLITFTIDGTSFQAESGMTWAQWVASDYNTADFVVNSGYVYEDVNYGKYVAGVASTDIITSNYAYVLVAAGGANSLDDGPVVASTDTPVTISENGEWQIVSNSPLKATGIDVSYPVYERNEFADDINLDYPDFNRYISKFRGIGNVDINADFTGWIATATSGFLNFELLPNFSIGGVLAILVGFSLVILFLKIFAGG